MTGRASWMFLAVILLSVGTLGAAPDVAEGGAAVSAERPLPGERIFTPRFEELSVPIRFKWLEGEVQVDPQLRAEAEAGGTIDFFVQARVQADLAPAYSIGNWSDRGWYVYEVQRAATEALAPVIAYVEDRGLAWEMRRGINALYIHGGTMEDVRALAARPDVKRLRANHVYPLDDTERLVGPEAFGWNLDQLDPNAGNFGMEASQVWSGFGVDGGCAGCGYNGEDHIVVANIDTGVYYQHIALDRQYRGNTTGAVGGPYDHNYNWWDPSNVCGSPSTAPCDNHGHGSGTMGIMVGETADLVEQIGVAPGAVWLACKGCEGASCSEAALTGCADFLTAPWDLTGANPNPDMRPHIVNNSWGGGGCDNWYDTYISSWRAAGIFPAFSAGNTTACSAVGSPGDSPAAFGTAAHNSSGDNLYAGGPSCYHPTPTCDPSLHDIDPHLNAPTFGRTSDNSAGAYYNLGGTSGASPHTAACIALMWEANPSLIGQIDETFTLLEQTADRTWTGAGAEGVCGKPACAGTDIYPNYEYGWGFLDCYAAVAAAADSCNPDLTPPQITCPPDAMVNTDPGVCTSTFNYTPPVGTDNCPGPTTALTAGLGPGAAFPVGTTTETYTVTDGAGLTASCSFTVNVTDNENPTALCRNLTVPVDDTGTAVITPAQVDNGSGDNCGVDTMTLDRDTFACADMGDNTVTLTVTDVNGNVDTCQATVTVTCADLAVAKTVAPDPVIVGQQAVYTVTVTNSGPGDAANVVLTDTLPAQVAYVSCATTQGTCAEAAGTVTATIGAMAPGAVVTVTITADVVAGGDLVNTASATSDAGDPDPANNTSTVVSTANAYDRTFYDDYGRSFACVNTLTGDWEWTSTDPRNGIFNTGMQPGIAAIRSGVLTLRAPGGMPWSMELKHNMTVKYANGYFQYLAYRIKSSLLDQLTTNDPPVCDAPPNP